LLAALVFLLEIPLIKMEESQNLDEAPQGTSVVCNSDISQFKSQQGIPKERMSLITRLLSTPTLADAATVVGFFLGGVGLAIA
jgi:hypothetical protein